jgi:mannan endo-1,4-beta-mannosidase
MRARALAAIVAGALLPLVASCTRSPAGAPSPARASMTVDPAATPETRALFEKLRAMMGQGVLFGHQDDLAYGYHWRAEPGRSDVRETAGAYPAVYGWDLGGIEMGAPANLDGVPFERMREWMAEGFGRGGVVTASWHLRNPVSGGDSWDTTRAVAAILPGGARHAEYRRWLDRVADFALSLRGRTRDGREVAIPVVVRPFHEMTGGWFWWGSGHARREEYVALWRFTVDYLRRERGVHNLLYAYSPNVGGDPGWERYLDFYPGDAYVDVLGWDEYFWPSRPGDADPAARLTTHLRWLVAEAERRGKVAALTETGYETVPDSLWWTGTLRRAIASDSLARRIAWVLVWRNAYRPGRAADHFYAPYAGHPSAADFARLKRDPLFFFEDELPDLYRPRGARR